MDVVILVFYIMIKTAYLEDTQRAINEEVVEETGTVNTPDNIRYKVSSTRQDSSGDYVVKVVFSRKKGDSSLQ